MTYGRLWCYAGCASALVSLSLMSALARAAAAAAPATYRGHTSQGRAISFSLSGRQITGLAFQVEVTCPSRRVWLVTALNFAPIRVARARFSQTFASLHPSATATVSGTVGRGGEVAGTVSIRRFIAPEHHYCAGAAAFAVRRATPAPSPSGGHGRQPGSQGQNHAGAPPAFTAGRRAQRSARVPADAPTAPAGAPAPSVPDRAAPSARGRALASTPAQALPEANCLRGQASGTTMLGSERMACGPTENSSKLVTSRIPEQR